MVHGLRFTVCGLRVFRVLGFRSLDVNLSKLIPLPFPPPRPAQSPGQQAPLPAAEAGSNGGKG